jgi:hypothetical protein
MEARSISHLFCRQQPGVSNTIEDYTFAMGTILEYD